MTTTPTLWKSKFNPNFSGLGGEQYQPHSIGLANGNFLVIWGDNSFGPGAGADLVGRIFDPLGNPAGMQFQVNQAFTASGEFKGRLAAMPDGGFIMVYQSNDLIVVERFDDSGLSVASNTITGASLPSGDPRFDVTVNAAGDYVVSYSRAVVDHGIDIRALVFNNASNLRGAEHLNTARNGTSNDVLGDIDTFTNGNIIAISHNVGPLPGVNPLPVVNVTITSPTGALVLGPTLVSASSTFISTAHDVAVLDNGNFAALYQRGGTFAVKIGAVGSSAIQIGPEIVVGTASQNGQPPSIVSLQDGGFFVAWINSNTVFGTRYSSSGAVIGDQAFVVATGASGDLEALGQLSLTSDGRILVPFRGSDNEIAEVILDPRETVIFGTDQRDVLTGQTTSSFVDGKGGDDRIIGRDGIDVLSGGDGTDTISGGLSGDYIYGEGQQDFLYGNKGDDFLYGADGDDYIDGDFGNDSLFGGIGFDYLSGGADNDILDGGANGDLMQGFSGNDTYYIDSSTDIVDELLAGSNGSDIVRSSNLSINLAYASVFKGNVESAVLGGGGNLNLTGNALGNYLQGNTGANIINGGGGSDTLVGLGGADTFRFANSLGPTNIDKITDYSVPQDKIELENAYFTALPTGFLFASAFVANTTGLAQDASDRIIYETDTGKLFYDSNGTAAGGTYQQFATLSAGLAMSAGEFFVV